VTASEAAGCGFNSRHAHHIFYLTANNMKTALPWILVVALLAAVYFLYASNHQKDATISQLQQENQQVDSLRTENEQLKKIPDQSAEIDRLRKDNEDLLRLRNETSQLRQQNQQLNRQLQTAQTQAGQVQQQLATQTEAFHAQSQQIQQAQIQAQTDECIGNLRRIDSAKQQWALEHNKTAGSIPVASDLTPYLPNGVFPVCPAGGSYTLNAVNLPPSCTVSGHVLPPAQ
jgi:septal ring factor EnvC (AmiA/AmiB activator)